jgi:hypothetical protein
MDNDSENESMSNHNNKHSKYEQLKSKNIKKQNKFKQDDKKDEIRNKPHREKSCIAHKPKTKKYLKQKLLQEKINALNNMKNKSSNLRNQNKKNDPSDSDIMKIKLLEEYMLLQQYDCSSYHTRKI